MSVACYTFGGVNVKIIIKYVALILSLVLVISVFTAFSSSAYTSTAAADIQSSGKSDIWSYLNIANAEIYNGKDIVVDIKNDILTDTVSVEKYDSKENTVLLNDGKENVQWKVNCPENALYNISIEYQATSDSDADIKLSCSINGEIPYETAENISLSRVWIDDGEPWKDEFGNESSPIQKQQPQWITEYFNDASGLYENPLPFSLNSGENTIGLSVYGGDIIVSKIVLSGYVEADEYAVSLDENRIYDGEDIVIQAENAILKSSKELRPLADNTDPSVSPSNAFCSRINYIGGSNWNSVGEKITWEFDVPKSAYYKVSFKYRQEYLTNASSIRSMQIDGKTPFKECKSIAFPYSTDWSMITMGDETPYYLWLEKGTHTISLNVSLGPIAQISSELQELIYDIGELYRKIIMITGTTPDSNRDYRLYEQIPTLTDELNNYIDLIDDIVERYDAITGADGGSNATTLKNLGLVLERMNKSKFSAQDYVSDLFNNYSSASAWVYEMRSMSLDIDQIIIGGTQYNEDVYKSGFFEKFIFNLKKLVASFSIDYNKSNLDSETKSIDLWVNIGRDQSKVLSRMIEDTFTPNTGIKVNVKVSSATMVQANLSGNAPDCTILQSKSTPVDLAMRGTLYDLSQFEDFNDVVIERYGSDSLITPYRYKDGIYGLPDTETFNIMFVRTDVFEQLGLSIPETWDEFMRCTSVIMRNNLSVGVPQMYTTFLYQYNGTLYNNELTETNLKTTDAIAAFEFFTDIYCEYKLPVTFSFYNRFRTGEMPLAISPYTEYATLLSAASEIGNCWGIYAVPGTVSEDGINTTVIGEGTAAVMLKSTSDPQSSWQFLKWWTDADTQYRYSTDVESIVGTAARHATANIHALKRFTWERGDAEKIASQYENVINLPEVPGGYYLTRALDNAFYSVQSEGENPKEMLIKWANMVDEEMKRKIEEYS